MNPTRRDLLKTTGLLIAGSAPFLIWIAANNPKQRSAPEEDVYRFARGSVVADKDLPAGHVIGEADIWARRPGSGEIAAYDFDKVLGKRLTRSVTRNTQLKWGDLG